MRIIHLVSELRDNMPSLSLAPQLACDGVHTPQAEMTALLTSLLAVALHLTTLACIACFGDPLLS